MPQRHALSYKNSLVNNYFQYIDTMRQYNLSEDCVKNASFLPPTYRLYNKQECRNFFNYTFSEEYKAREQRYGPQFLTKMGLEVHRGRGITLLLQPELKALQESYNNGSLCGKKSDLLIAQTYISNPYLYQGHKIEFRIYWVLASTNPIIAYAFDKALIRRCIFPFDIFSQEKGAHVCNTAITKKVLEQNRDDTEKSEDDDDEEELFIDWKLDHLQELLLKEGKIKDSNWLENYLYPMVDRYIIHTIRSTQSKYGRDSKLAEFFAADFLLTDDLKIHILEINYNPQTLKTTPLRIFWHTKMVRDMMDIQDAYLRSRYLRLKKVVSKVVEKMSKSRMQLKTVMSEKVLEEFREAYRDRLDQGIQLQPDNLFRLVMDENLPDTKKYKDLVQPQCILS